MSILSIIVTYLVVKQPIYSTTLLQRKQHFSLFSFLTLASTWANCRASESWCFHHKVNIDHFTLVCLVAWPLNEGEAEGDLALI